MSTDPHEALNLATTRPTESTAAQAPVATIAKVASERKSHDEPSKTSQRLSQRQERNVEAEEKARLERDKADAAHLPLRDIFRFSSKSDRLLILIGTRAFSSRFLVRCTSRSKRTLTRCV